MSASADPNHGDAIYWSGAWWPFGGTSQAAPLWAALVADTNQGCAAPAGLINPTLYAAGSTTSFNDVTVGDNNLFGGSPVPRRAPATTWPRGGGAPGPPHSWPCCRGRRPDARPSPD